MHPGYLTKQESIAVLGVANLHIRSLLDRQQFFDPLGDAQALGISSAAWPLFGLLWPSGAQLAQRMAQRALQPAERILEIGCGLGLPSLVAHRRGANVTASDCHPLAHSFLLANLALNQLPPLPYWHGHWGVGAAELESSSAPYDLIIASDVLYERDTQGCLADFMQRHCAPQGEVWVVDPDRGNRSAFSRNMAARGFGSSEERLDSLATSTALAYKGRLCVYRRGPAVTAVG